MTTKKWLDTAEYEPFAPTTPGHLISVNHQNCPAGHDTKRRLRVKRCADGAIVAYCHHCQMRGAMHSHQVSFQADTLIEPPGFEQPLLDVVKRGLFLRDLVEVPLRDKSGHLAFLKRKHLLSSDVLGVMGSRDEPQIGYPVFGRLVPKGHVELLAVQTRRRRVQPKYVNECFLKQGSLSQCVPYIYGQESEYVTGWEIDTFFGTRPPLSKWGHGTEKALWLVEDYPLALRLADLGEMAVPLNGCALSTFALIELAKQCGTDKCVVWLDNDSLGVRAQASVLYQRIRCVFDKAMRHDVIIPKELRVSLLANAVDDARKRLGYA